MSASRPKRRAHDKGRLRDLFREYSGTRDPALREQLVLAHADLAHYLARKFAHRGEPLEDIIQVAQVGLLNAVDRYDPAYGTEFTTFATSTIVGEIRRYFRDKSWRVHVPRRLRERNNTVMRVSERLAQHLGRAPNIAELSEATGLSFEEVVEALELGRAFSPVSLDATLAENPEEHAPALAESLGEEDPELGRLEDRHALEHALRTLPERDQTILRLRYYEGLSQAQIARRLGISQMHVSRLQRKALERLRAALIA